MTTFICSSPIRDWIRSMPWNLVMHLNPQIRSLDNRTAEVFAGKYLLYSSQRLFGRNPESHKASLVLIPEICPQGFVHFHGFAYLSNAKKREKFLRSGSLWWESHCRNQFNGGKVPISRSMSLRLQASHHGATSHIINPSAVIEAVRVSHRDCGETESLGSAIEYACKGWEAQHKESQTVFYGRRN